MPVDATEIERELRHIGRCLSTPRTMISFGGCAMSIQGFKDSTRDTDLVVLPPDGLHGLLLDLHKAGYEPTPKDIEEIVADHAHLPTGWALEAWLVVERPGGLRIDLFPPTNVFKGLRFGASMLERTHDWLVEGLLTVRIADASVMFMTKSITGRWRNPSDAPFTVRRDLEDLPPLLSRGSVDWTFVETEWRQQSAHLGAEHIRNAREAVDHMKRLGFHVPWKP